MFCVFDNFSLILTMELVDLTGLASASAKRC